MADEARPLSRRERREMEEQAAAGLAPVPVASSAPDAAQSLGLDAVDASGLSRRDRRRLERLDQPMETWTAVEEMHHTGQVPTMTPEVIAQQEELARRRAAEAQADAVAATGEIRQVAPGEIRQVAPGEIRQVAPGETRQVAPGETRPTAPVEAAAPVISRYDMPDEAPEPPRSASSGPGDDARRRLAQAAAEAAAQAPTERERPAVPTRREPGFIDAPRPLTAEVPSLADLTPPSGIRAAQNSFARGAPAATPQPAFAGEEAPYPPTGGMPAPYPYGAPPPAYSGPPVVQAQPPVVQAQPPVVQAQPPVIQGQPPVVQGQPPVVQGQPPVVQAQPPQGLPTIPAPAHPSAPLPVVGQVMPGTPQGAFGTPPPAGFGPPTGAIPTQGGPSPYPPGTALSPIVTGMLRPVPGATGTMRAIPGAGPMTGTIPRPIIEVQPAGGAKEFGWPHIALLAAAAFVLGLVVWQISGLGG